MADNKSPKVLTEAVDRTWIITINRASKMNCVDGETAAALEQAWLRFRDDDELYVAILTGAGDESFCSGADLKAAQTLGPSAGASVAEHRRFVTHGSGYMGYTRGTDIYKPIICAVNGYAFAGGLELACLGDLRIASENAEFWVACRRWNVPLVDGGTQRLPRIVGMGHAMDLILRARRIDAAEAHRIGLANGVLQHREGIGVAYPSRAHADSRILLIDIVLVQRKDLVGDFVGTTAVDLDASPLKVVSGLVCFTPAHGIKSP